MQNGLGFRSARRAIVSAVSLVGLCAVGIAPPAAVLAQQQPASSQLTADNSSPFRLTYVQRRAANCQVPLPPVGAVSPFPLALRLGALISPRFLFDGGIDATISGLRLLPNLQSRVDADVIISANFGGVRTLIPVTFDQLLNLNLPVSSRIYLGAGAGAYFSSTTRFGGKIVVGAEFAKKLGIEGNLHFAGIGPTLITVQARIGL